LRGAITVSLPAKPLVEAIASQRRTALVLGALLIGFGTVAILLLGRIARIQREALAKLRDLSLCDPLTGIHNRRGFTERSQQALRTLAREKGRAVLAFADLDGLKPINDTHGHKRGDEALKRLAKVLRPAFRGSDVVARIGGDEFAILFVDADWQYRAVLQKRIDKCVARANDGWTGSLPIEVSVGMVEINFSDRRQQEPPSVDELLSLADTRMYAVKVERRNTGTF
jgi:diguanylate cyclase (GGDEF)-like protein